MSKSQLLEFFESLNDDGKEKLLKKAFASESREPFKGDVEDTTERLISHYKCLARLHEFKPGMLVQWKAGLRNRMRPKEKEPAIVVQQLEEPVLNDPDGEAGTPYYREPLDLILGVLDEDGDFICYHYDSRRFEPLEKRKMNTKQGAK